MKLVHIKDIKDIKSYPPLTLCLGFFDALHVGHLALINKAKERKEDIGVLTFSKSPRTLLFNQEEDIINTIDMKEEILRKYDVKYLFILDLSWDILNLEKEEFINIILRGLNVKNIVCGFDYSFGKKGSGKPSDLIKTNLFNVDVIEPVCNHQGIKISSTLIHHLIDQGEIEEVNKYLTRPYKIQGDVNHGFKVGRRLNYKTANIELNERFHLPKNGVYATKVIVDDKEYFSMTNVGVHPTINLLDKPLIETYIFDFEDDIYSKNIEVLFYKRVRDEIKFDSVEELKNQLIQDEELIKNYFNS